MLELWRHRELLYFLVWRDIKVRYKQTVLGMAWAVIQPLVIAVMLSIFLGRLAKIPSNGLPYPVFAYSAMVMWQLFAQALTGASNSLLANERMITKVDISPPYRSAVGGIGKPGGFRNRAGGPDIVPVLLSSCAHADDNAGSIPNRSDRTHCIGRRILACCPECKVPGCPLHLGIPRPILVLCKSDCISRQCCARTLASVVWSQSDGRGAGRVSVGSARHGETAAAFVGEFCVRWGGNLYDWPLLLSANRGDVCGHHLSQRTSWRFAAMELASATVLDGVNST